MVCVCVATLCPRVFTSAVMHICQQGRQAHHNYLTQRSYGMDRCVPAQSTYTASSIVAVAVYCCRHTWYFAMSGWPGANPRTPSVMFLVGLFGVLLRFRQCCGLGRLLRFRQGSFMLSSFDIPVHALTCQKSSDVWAIETLASVLALRQTQTELTCRVSVLG